MIATSNPVFVTGVSFNDDSLEIIYLDNDEQKEEYGFLHTVFLKADGDIKESFDLIQAELRNLIDQAWDMKMGRRQPTSLKTLVESRQASQEVFAPDEDDDEDDEEEVGFVRLVKDELGVIREEDVF